MTRFRLASVVVLFVAGLASPTTAQVCATRLTANKRTSATCDAFVASIAKPGIYYLDAKGHVAKLPNLAGFTTFKLNVTWSNYTATQLPDKTYTAVGLTYT